jgi:hypothetical protein
MGGKPRGLKLPESGFGGRTVFRSSANLAGGWLVPWGKVPAVAWFVTATHRLGGTRNCTTRANREISWAVIEKPTKTKISNGRRQRIAKFTDSNSTTTGKNDKRILKAAALRAAVYPDGRSPSAFSIYFHASKYCFSIG